MMANDVRLILTELMLDKEQVTQIEGAFDRMIFVANGSLTTTDTTHVRRNEAFTALHVQGSAELRAEQDRTILWIWTLDRIDMIAPLPIGATLKMDQKLGDIDGIDNGLAVMRIDRVDFPAGAAAHTHVHPGPGIRIVLFGSIGIQQGDADVLWMGAGEPWCERGPDPVFAPTTDKEPTAFIRCMVLPPQWRGKNTIRYVNPADAKKPKRQQYYRFCDASVSMPTSGLSA